MQILLVQIIRRLVKLFRLTEDKTRQVGSNNNVCSYNGRNSAATLTTGDGNTALGSGSMNSQTTADNNTAVGYDSLYFTTTGANNAAFGKSALQANTTGANNVAAWCRSS